MATSKKRKKKAVLEFLQLMSTRVCKSSLVNHHNKGCCKTFILDLFNLETVVTCWFFGCVFPHWDRIDYSMSFNPVPLCVTQILCNLKTCLFCPPGSEYSLLYGIESIILYMKPGQKNCPMTVVQPVTYCRFAFFL